MRIEDEKEKSVLEKLPVELVCEIFNFLHGRRMCFTLPLISKTIRIDFRFYEEKVMQDVLSSRYLIQKQHIDEQKKDFDEKFIKISKTVDADFRLISVVSGFVVILELYFSRIISGLYNSSPAGVFVQNSSGQCLAGEINLTRLGELFLINLLLFPFSKLVRTCTDGHCRRRRVNRSARMLENDYNFLKTLAKKNKNIAEQKLDKQGQLLLKKNL